MGADLIRISTRKGESRRKVNSNNICMWKAEQAVNFEGRVKNAWADTRPTIFEFADIYPREKIQADEDRLKKKRARIFAQGAFDKGEDFELSEDLEYCLMEGIHNRGWFKDSVSVSPGSQYDDMFHGVDLIVNFRIDDNGGEPRYEYLSIDATVSQDVDVLERKDAEIQRNLRNGQMGIAEYFINDDAPEIKGTIRMPQVVYNLLPAEAAELRRLLGQGDSLSFDDQKLLTRFRDDIVNKIIDQLKKYIDFLGEAIRVASPDVKIKQAAVRQRHRAVLELVVANKNG